MMYLIQTLVAGEARQSRYQNIWKPIDCHYNNLSLCQAVFLGILPNTGLMVAKVII